MNCLIIEDEFPAAERLKALIPKVAPDLEVADTIESVAKAVAWLRTHAAPDLIFSDIQLSDGLSFDIYEQQPVGSPVIFTTAYDEYAIKAFQVNSVDYLLKPIKPEALKAALTKWENWQQRMSPLQVQTDVQKQLQAILSHIQPENRSYKRRFLVSAREEWVPVEEEEIAYFSTAHENVYLVRKDGRRFVIEFTLDQLGERLDPALFFRLNRQYIGHLASVSQIKPYFNGRLSLLLTPDPGASVIISREKVAMFKAWMEGEL